MVPIPANRDPRPVWMQPPPPKKAHRPKTKGGLRDRQQRAETPRCHP
jgi:hypothetical protein